MISENIREVGIISKKGCLRVDENVPIYSENSQLATAWQTGFRLR